MQSRGCLYTADLRFPELSADAAPQKLRDLLHQSAARQLQSRVLLLHGPPELTAAAAAAAKQVLPEAVVADAAALITLEKKQQEQLQQQQRPQQPQQTRHCCYCGDHTGDCPCSTDVRLRSLRGPPSICGSNGGSSGSGSNLVCPCFVSTKSCTAAESPLIRARYQSVSMSVCACICNCQAGVLLSRAVNKLAMLTGASLVVLRIEPSLLGATEAGSLAKSCRVLSFIHLLLVTSKSQVVKYTLLSPRAVLSIQTENQAADALRPT